MDESKQIQLSMITPIGTTDTEEQLLLRDRIRQQQVTLDKLNKSKLININQEENWFEFIQTNLQDWGVDRFGISPIIEEYTYSNSSINKQESRAIVFVIPMDYKKMQSVPSVESATEIFTAYAKTGEIVLKLTELLKTKGIQATGHHPLGDLNEYHHLLFPPHAYYAGLGEKGRTGLFIDHKYGPMVRLGIVTTELNLDFNSSKDLGINAFCHRCQYCVKYCPPRALPSGRYLESLERGIPTQFIIDGNKCIRYFEKHYGCGKCIVKCILVKDTQEAINKRMNRIFTWYDRWVKSGELETMNKMYRESISTA